VLSMPWFCSLVCISDSLRIATIPSIAQEPHCGLCNWCYTRSQQQHAVKGAEDSIQHLMACSALVCC
jgi:hypothetical protein